MRKYSELRAPSTMNECSPPCLRIVSVCRAPQSSWPPLNCAAMPARSSWIFRSASLSSPTRTPLRGHNAQGVNQRMPQRKGRAYPRGQVPACRGSPRHTLCWLQRRKPLGNALALVGLAVVLHQSLASFCL
eukprot:scaffold1007_cov364-Prasinococcus_capsulatus_cf.AAC.8